MNGLLLVDKPAGVTSHDVVDRVRRAVRTRRVGHAGTLDPFATGLLPVLVGRATRLMPFLRALDKVYEGTLRLGERTDTDDGTGRITTVDHGWRDVDDERLATVLRAHTGWMAQVPPAFSAKKVGGRRAYRMARRGESVALAPREVVVHRFEVRRRDGADVDFLVEVGSGTYVRALARDVGETLGCGAHVTALRRTRVGRWRVAEAVSPDRLGPDAIPVRPAADAVRHLPARQLSEAEHGVVRHGRAVPLAQPATGPVALLAGEHLVAVAEPSGTWLKPKVVLEG